MTLNLADLFEAVVDAVSERSCIVCGDERRTYLQLEHRANQLAHALEASGVEAGEHVGIHMRNSVQFVESILACLKIRAVPVNINYRYTEAELIYLYTDAQLTTVIADSEYLPVIQAALTSCPSITTLFCLGSIDAQGSGAAKLFDFELALAAQSTTRDFASRSADDRFIIYTGGTTGMPKGVVWRQEDFFMAALAGGNHNGPPFTDSGELAASAASNTQPMVTLLPAPLMHGAAVYSLFSGFFAGWKQVLMPAFDPHEALRLVQDEHVSCLIIVGDAMARPLADEIERHGGSFDLSALVMVSSGGALWSRSSKAQLLEQLPNLYLRDGFGASESGVDGTLETDENGITRVRGNPNMTLVNAELQPIPPGSDELGFIARSGHVPLGYFNDPIKTAKTFPIVDGVRMSVLGDMGRIESDGAIVLLGRGSGCINTGGEKVFPEEVEAALKSYPTVMDAVVTGIPHERYGEQVAAVIQLRDGARDFDEDHLVEHCRALIAGYKIPRSITLVSHVVRSPAGKADYRWARQVATTS
ncbi:acyl-CoA synthetase [Dietzia sp. NPDC055340]|uniref:acyl-CoA synthetase n=1 Tax=Arthrobacter koreensis TaxID=199136 RepID=UPI003671B7C4